MLLFSGGGRIQNGFYLYQKQESRWAACKTTSLLLIKASSGKKRKGGGGEVGRWEGVPGRGTGNCDGQASPSLVCCSLPAFPHQPPTPFLSAGGFQTGKEGRGKSFLQLAPGSPGNCCWRIAQTCSCLNKPSGCSHDCKCLEAKHCLGLPTLGTLIHQ